VSHRAEHDDHAACTDFGPMGEDCPFYTEGDCHFNGWQWAEPIPETGVCDKTEPAVPLDEVLKYGLMDVEQWEAMQKLRDSVMFKRWWSTITHYRFLSRDVRRKLEADILFNQTGLPNLRAFRKLFKPNERDLRLSDSGSFRTRILDFLHARQPMESPTSGTERVALTVIRATNFAPDPFRQPYEYWHPVFLTRYSALERVWRKEYHRLEALLGEVFREHEREAILVEWDWGIGPNESGWRAQTAQLVRVLDALPETHDR